jgi:hypothetical protein
MTALRGTVTIGLSWIGPNVRRFPSIGLTGTKGS